MYLTLFLIQCSAGEGLQSILAVRTLSDTECIIRLHLTRLVLSYIFWKTKSINIAIARSQYGVY